MGRPTKPEDFSIHVDPSCLTNSTDLKMSPERNTSNTTIVRHDSWAEDSPKKVELGNEKDQHTGSEDEQNARERQIDRIEAQIQAAARAVIASIQDDNYDANDDSVLSMQTDESHELQGTDANYDGTEQSYEEGTELTYESETDQQSEMEKEVGGTEVTCDSGNEEVSELVQDIDGIEDAGDSITQDESVPPHDMDTSEVNPELTIDHTSQDDGLPSTTEGAECDIPIKSIEDTRESEWKDHKDLNDDADSLDKHESEHEETSEQDQGGDSSSHHDGDIDDDVFSRNSSNSKRSSLNSCHDLHNGEETYSQKELTSPTIGEEASTRRESDAISRIPSAGSYMHPIPDVCHTTPSKVLARPPFRTPSSVRAMQMSSPTPSVYNSPRSIKRHHPTVSRIGTPTSHTSKNRTPTRFKARKEQPLVLLHVTVLPLKWPYSHHMSLPDLSDTLQSVKENWRLLQDKLGETVLERGVLLPHPQDSYEVLEERLLEALELPVRPRALILKCGHYMGPGELETSSSEDEGGDYWPEKDSQRKWCDICRRDVRLESSDLPDQKRFRVKIYASNGLMHAGAWAAAWREMERIDVEIGPWIEPFQHIQLENLAILKPTMDEEHDDGFIDEDVDEHGSIQLNAQEEDVKSHHVQDQGIDITTVEDTNASQDCEQDLEEENVDKSALEDNEHQPKTVDQEEHPPEERQKSVADYENEMRELLLEEERMRESHERSQRETYIPERPESPPLRTSTKRGINEDSFSELLVAAFKVAMRDRKNIAIVLLSFLVVVLALRPATSSAIHPTNSSALIAQNQIHPDIQSPLNRPRSVVSAHEILSEVPQHASEQILVATTKSTTQVQHLSPSQAEPLKSAVPCVETKTVEDLPINEDVPVKEGSEAILPTEPQLLSSLTVQAEGSASDGLSIEGEEIHDVKQAEEEMDNLDNTEEVNDDGLERPSSAMNDEQSNAPDKEIHITTDQLPVNHLGSVVEEVGGDN